MFMKSFVMLCSLFIAFGSLNAEAKKAEKKKAAKEAVVETFKVDVAASTATWVGIKKLAINTRVMSK